MIKISSLTICQDEEQFIGQMLEWLHTYVNPDEMIIVDGGSKDRTLEIINNFTVANTTANVLIYQNPMPDSFSEQRNLALSKCSGEWILHIDADETYSKNMKDLILDLREGKYTDVKGFLLPTAHLITDEFHMKNGGGDTHVRLFKKKNVLYIGNIHEKPDIKGFIMPFNVALRHYSLLKNEDALIIKGKRYLKWIEESQKERIPISYENYFVDCVNNFNGQLYEVPKEWE